MDSSESLLSLFENAKPTCEKLILEYNRAETEAQDESGEARVAATLGIAIKEVASSEYSTCFLLTCLVHYGLKLGIAMTLAEVLEVKDGFIAALEMREEAMEYFRDNVLAK